MKKRVFAVLCLLIALSAITASAREPFTGWKAEVENKLLNGEFDAAMAQLKGLASGNENDADYHFLLGKAASAKGDLNEALAQLDRAVALDGKHTLAMGHKAVILLQQDKAAEAEKEATRAIAIEPSGELYYARGAIQMSKGRLKKALADLDSAIMMEPKNIEYLIARGEVNLRRHQVKLAEEDYTKAILIDPGNAKAYLGRGGLYLIKGDQAASRIDLNKCVELAPNFASCYLRRGKLYQMIGEKKRAYDDFVKTTDLAPDSPEAWFERANAELDMNKFDAAEKSADRIVKINDGPRAQKVLGLVYSARGKLDEAISAFDKSIAATPEDFEALLFRGNAYALTKDFPHALADLNSAIKLRPDYIEAYLAKAGIQAAQKDMKGAIKTYDQAIAHAPDNPMLYNLRSQLHEAAGNFDASFADFKKAKELAAKRREGN